MIFKYRQRQVGIHYLRTLALGEYDIQVIYNQYAGDYVLRLYRTPPGTYQHALMHDSRHAMYNEIAPKILDLMRDLMA